MDPDDVIKEANQYIDQIDRSYRFIGTWVSWACIAMGVVLIGLYAYQYGQNGERIRQANVDLDRALNQAEGSDRLSTYVDLKLALYRADAKRIDPGAYAGAGILIAGGIVGLVTRRFRRRHVRLMRGLIELLQKR